MSERQHIKELIVVEGRCDVSAVKAAADCDVIETHGFGVFRSKEIGAKIRALAAERGVILLLDSDRAGFRIRSHLKSILGDLHPKQAYIPQIRGKERRKSAPSSDGYLGVEAMSADIILRALRLAGATLEDARSRPEGEKITKADLYKLGLSGGPDSAQKRAMLLSRLELPSGISANALLDILNLSFSKEEFILFLSQPS